MPPEIIEQSILEEVSKLAADSGIEVAETKDVEPEVSEVKEEEVQKEETKPVEIPEHEKTAREQGWTSKEEWVQAGKDPDEWKPAKRFLKDGELFEKINSQSKTIKDLQKKLETVVNYTKTVEQKTREKTLQELEALHVKAVEEGDVETAKRVNKQIVEIEKTPVEAVEDEKSDPVNEQRQLVDDFKARNKWFGADEELTDAAVAIEMAIRRRNPGIPLNEVFKQVEDKIKKTFSDKFENPIKDKPSTIVAPSQEATIKSKDSKKTSWNDLSKEMRDIYTMMKNAGVYNNLEEFIDEHKRLGVI